MRELLRRDPLLVLERLVPQSGGAETKPDVAGAVDSRQIPGPPARAAPYQRWYRVTRGFLGIAVQRLTTVLAPYFGAEPGKGVLVSQVSEGRPAAVAGVRQGDVILSFAGEPVKDVGRFRQRVALSPPGSRAELAVARQGAPQTVAVIVGRRSSEEQAADASIETLKRVGLTVQDLTEETAARYRIAPGEGVLIVGVLSGSAAAAAGIEGEAVILEVDREPVEDVAALRERLQVEDGERRVLLLVREGRVQRYVVLSW